ncbi:hypothetical protein BACI349Y_580132 [Bacillus sp. 349Y]|nr:hypothetical protein BACI349Y_580132 [Bacillus sp. 349Y]
MLSYFLWLSDYSKNNKNATIFALSLKILLRKRFLRSSGLLTDTVFLLILWENSERMCRWCFC